MSKYSLLAKFGADTTQFKRAMKNTRKDTDQFGKQMAKMGGMLAGVFGTQQLVSFGKKALDLYNVQAQAETKLKTALDGNIASFERLSKLAGDLQGQTLFGDEATIEAMSFLAQMNMTESEIRTLIPLVQDFAQAQNMDLGNAAKLVAKSFGSSTNALSRYGIEISGAAGSSGRLADLTGALNDMVGGQAAAAADEGTASVKQLSNTWGDFAEVIGEKLAPALNKASTASADLLGGLTQVIGAENLNFWEKLAAVFDRSGMGVGLAIAENATRGAANANANVNMQLPEWYVQMQREWEAQAKEAARRAANAYTGSFLQTISSGGVDGDIKSGSFKPIIADMVDFHNAADEHLIQASEQVTAAMQSMVASMAADFAEGIGHVMAGTASFGDVFKHLLGQMAEFTTQIGKMMIQLASAAIAMRTLLWSNPFALLAVGVGLTVLGGMMKGLMQGGGGGMPALAEGGLAYGPTAAIVGDNPRASVDPEVIAPLSKLNGLAGGNVNVHGRFVLEGDKLVAAVRKYNNRYSATNGGPAIVTR